MAKIIGGIGTSHVPSLGVMVDNGKTQDPYWKPVFDGMIPAKQWMAENKPDVCIIVYNDHASAFSLELIPTFAIGVADEYQPADEGYGPRQVPVVKGNSRLGWHLAESLIMDEFDMTIVNNMDVDHGLTVPLSVAYGEPEAWPCEVIPLCVNMVQYPQPSGNRCFNLGKAIRKAVESYDEDITIAIFGTGGLSHQLQGERAGVVNPEYDEQWLDMFIDEPHKCKMISRTELLRETGSEGVECLMWHVMRGAMTEQVEVKHRFTHLPCSNTNYGLLVLEDKE